MDNVIPKTYIPAQPPTRKVRIYKSHPNAKIEVPRVGDAGIDLRATKDVVIPPHGDGEILTWNIDGTKTDPKPKWIVRIDTGIHIEIPEGWYGRVSPRSSVGAGKHIDEHSTPDPYGGLILVASIIDSSYRGPIIVALANITKREQTFKAGDKIAQLILMPYLAVGEFETVENLEDLSSTNRGAKGFGSTGKS